MERQEAIKNLWETVVSDSRNNYSIEYRKIHGYDSTKLKFNVDGEFILIKTTAMGKDTYSIFKPIGLKQRFVEALIRKLNEQIANFYEKSY